MERIWAPWRIQYIEAERDDSCVLCDKPRQKNDKDNYVLYRGESSFVIMNLYPYISGHLMVAPFRHLATLEELSPDERGELMSLVTSCTSILKEIMQPEGFNVGANIGKVAGAGIEEHLHVHVVPRWERDTNFMPVLSDTRIIPEALTATYEKLFPLFERLQAAD